MKVAFVNPSPNAEIKDRVKAEASWPPLGLLYMASMLNEQGVEASILDQPAKGYSIEETVDWILREEPDVVGFSGLSMSGRNAALTSMEVKRRNPDITVAFGGLYATFNSERVMSKYPSVDIVVRGEGEATIVELVDVLESNRPLKDVVGITFRDGDSLVSTPDRPLIEDLDILPFPDRSLLDDEYHSKIGGANIAVKKFTSVVSSRGCPFSCRFCCCTKLVRGRWRSRSVDNTLEELHYLASEGFEQFIFVDDCFTLNPKRTIEICSRMRKEGLDFEWICEGRVDSSSYEMMKEISRAGCKILYLGIESANKRILDYYNKRINPQQSEETVRSARKAGMDLIMGTFIVGGPDETRKEIWNTLNFAKKLDLDIPQFNVLGIHPGMDLWKELQLKGFVDEERYWEAGVSVSRICPTAVPFEEIVEMITAAVNSFTFRPGFLLRGLGRILASPYRRGVVWHNLSNWREILETFQDPIG
ncbi:B12-binding domain-containing radical SAM protein [Thermoproteota archaeon]